MPDKSHKIAAKQAELARKKRKHFEPRHPTSETIQANSVTQLAGTETSAVATATPVPEEVRARPSLMSSYKAVSTQPDSSKKPAARNLPMAQAEYFGADIRRILITMGICIAILIGLTFVLR